MKRHGLVFLLLLSACQAEPPSALTLTPVDFMSLPEWQAEDSSSALSAFRESCQKFSSHPQTIPLQIANISAARGGWENTCHAAFSANDAAEFFSSYFTPYQAVAYGSDTQGLLTGYYEPLLKGSYTSSEEYPNPVWGVPTDLAAGVPYLTHREIDEQGLTGRATPLLYVNDKVDLFFLHIQGSGRVELPDGQIVKLSYAGKNNRSYTALGKYLSDNGIIPRSELSLQRLKKWLRENPEEARDAMWQNESYVFFSFGDANKGAIGAQGVPLTPEASIAVDPTMLPYGVPVYLNTNLPYTYEKYHQLVVTQDTGGAIKGPLRADLFFGPGERAEHLAGGMKQMAQFYVLLPK